MAQGRTQPLQVQRYTGGTGGIGPDQVVVEEPLEIRLDGVRVTTTMRTPGHDHELAAGFCFTDGLLGGATVLEVRNCRSSSGMSSEIAPEISENVVVVDTAGLAPPPAPRLGTTTSSCGWCGSDMIDDVLSGLGAAPSPLAIDPGSIDRLPQGVAEHQDLFEATGGAHAAAAFDADGRIRLVREDIGRHNAVDKLVGRMLLDGDLPATGLGLYVSGRVSFEIVQKAVTAGFGAIVAVSAPSSLAVDAARTAGISLAGFARPGRLNVYVDASR